MEMRFEFTKESAISEGESSTSGYFDNVLIILFDFHYDTTLVPLFWVITLLVLDYHTIANSQWRKWP
jgi:hypothetical protein